MLEQLKVRLKKEELTKEQRQLLMEQLIKLASENNNEITFVNIKDVNLPKDVIKDKKRIPEKLSEELKKNEKIQEYLGKLEEFCRNRIMFTDTLDDDYRSKWESKYINKNDSELYDLYGSNLLSLTKMTLPMGLLSLIIECIKSDINDSDSVITVLEKFKKEIPNELVNRKSQIKGVEYKSKNDIEKIKIVMDLILVIRKVTYYLS